MSDGDSMDEDCDGESKTVQALRRDMIRIMKELKADKENGKEGKELWCSDCKTEGHTKGSCPRKTFCDICQVIGHSIKECPYNLKTRNTQALFTQPNHTVSDTSEVGSKLRRLSWRVPKQSAG